MDENSVKGLIGAVGKAIAGMAQQHGEELDRLESIDSRDDFRTFLERVELGISEPSRSDFIDEVTREGKWQDYKSQLAASTNMQWHELTSPGA